MSARRDRTAQAFRADPAIAALRRRVAALGDGAAGDRLVAAAGPLLRDLSWVRRLVGRAVAAMAADPWHEPPFRPLPHGQQAGLVLWEGGGLRVGLARVALDALAAQKAVPVPRRSIGFTGLLVDTRVIRGEAVLHWWEAPPAGTGFTAASAGTARRGARQRLAEGDRFFTDGRSRAWTLAHASGDLLLLQATAAAPDAPLAIEYDVANGAFRSAAAVDETVPRLQLMATLLRQMDRRDAAPAIVAAAAGLPFFGRWHLLRELAALDGAAAVPAFRAAKGDPHPELSAAAGAALARLAA